MKNHLKQRNAKWPVLCSVLGGLNFLVFKKMTTFTRVILPESIKCLLIKITLSVF